jgi:hypothetical protein
VPTLLTNKGTGIVTSVPLDSADDHIALQVGMVLFLVLRVGQEGEGGRGYKRMVDVGERVRSMCCHC